MYTTPIVILVDEPTGAMLDRFVELTERYTTLFLNYSAADALAEQMPDDLAEAFAQHDEVLQKIVTAICSPYKGDATQVSTRMWLKEDESLPLQDRLPRPNTIFYMDSVSKLAADYQRLKRAG